MKKVHCHIYSLFPSLGFFLFSLFYCAKFLYGFTWFVAHVWLNGPCFLGDVLGDVRLCSWYRVVNSWLVSSGRWAGRPETNLSTHNYHLFFHFYHCFLVRGFIQSVTHTTMRVVTAAGLLTWRRNTWSSWVTLPDLQRKEEASFNMMSILLSYLITLLILPMWIYHVQYVYPTGALFSNQVPCDPVRDSSWYLRYP
jgi:hypothetical protein